MSWWSLVIVPDNYSCLVIFLSLQTKSIDLSTDMTHIQVWTPSGPKYTDPLSATLTHFSRSQTHFCPENRKIKKHITLSFTIGFWWNFVEMDPHRTPSWWPTFRWPWPTSSGQTRNRPEILCLRFGHIYTSQNNSYNGIGCLLLRTNADRSLVKIG